MDTANTGNAGHLEASSPTHFYLLDALRGVAALTVVLWHWQHFYYQGTTPGANATDSQPLASLFHPLYTSGWRAVSLFFCLSGFIFQWLYAERITSRQISWREFWILRISRLYPLHVITLVLVAAGQFLLHANTGSYFVYSENTWSQFVLHLFMASDWGIGPGNSFNGPVWSVSVEILLYGVFYLLCRSGWVRNRKGLLVVVVLAFAGSHVGLPERISVGLRGFFTGCLAFECCRGLLARGISTRHLAMLASATCLLWVVITFNEAHLTAYGLFKKHLWSEAWNFHGRDLVGGFLLIASQLAYEPVLFPVTVATLALLERRAAAWSSCLKPLGNITYSSYLLHFPIQLLAAIVIFPRISSREVFNGPWTLGLFFAVLIAVSLASYRWLERPAQEWLRRRMLGK